MNLFQKIGQAIGSFFSKEAPVFENALTKAVSIVNIIKTLMGTATGQTVIAVFEALLPGAGAAVITALNIFFTGFGIVAKDLTGTPEDIAAAGLNAVAKLTGNSKIYALSNITSIIANEADNALGGTSTAQQAIVTVPVAYNANVLNIMPVVATTSTPELKLSSDTPPAPGTDASLTAG